MAKDLNKGDQVEWDTSQGKTHGIVERKQTSRTQIKGRDAFARALGRFQFDRTTLILNALQAILRTWPEGVRRKYTCPAGAPSCA
jgi:Hypervirulence associated proteins TUDOR domain